MRSGRVLLLLALLSGGCAGAASLEPPLTKHSARAMDPEALNRRVLGEVGRNFLPVDRRATGGPPPTRALDVLHFVAPARTADQPGLCFSDHAVVEFEPVGELAGADTPVRPARIFVHQDYFVRDAALMARSDPRRPMGSEDFWRSEAQACAAADPRRAKLFHSAADPRTAALLLGHALRAVGEARREQLPQGASCENSSDAEDDAPAPECVARLARSDVAAIDAIEECLRGEFEQVTCYNLVRGIEAIEIRLDPTNGAPTTLRAHTVITTYHPPPD